MPQARRAELLDLVVQLAVTDAKTQADEAGVQLESTDPAPLWVMTWRIDSTEWMLRHRRALVNAL
ncbi:hypothetical protein GTR02_09700 [Kineococcus sp. R8]|uniref:hypothetical protein n=1 Tax=Kineococcus siccus TaxID=2696567 RepID=UPI001412F0A4|nr:hypothetical protein [Kineococcus siccus]NAZ82090.1 hypothetical protein [Kineococcus siccus]